MINRRKGDAVRKIQTGVQNRRQSGATLLEVLIAMVVMSLGILGHAGLQAAALKVNQGALVRSQATSLAYEILDRMRANQTVALNGAYDISIGENKSGSGIADKDVSAWKTRLANALPSGDGAICRTNDATKFDCGASGNIFVIQVQWIEANEENKDRAKRDPIQIMGQL